VGTESIEDNLFFEKQSNTQTLIRPLGEEFQKERKEKRIILLGSRTFRRIYSTGELFSIVPIVVW